MQGDARVVVTDALLIDGEISCAIWLRHLACLGMGVSVRRQLEAKVFILVLISPVLSVRLTFRRGKTPPQGGLWVLSPLHQMQVGPYIERMLYNEYKDDDRRRGIGSMSRE